MGLCLATQAAARSPGLCETGSPSGDAPYVAIFSAFPAEAATLAERMDIETTVDVGGRRWHLGRLGGVHVVLGLMGIGLVNAEASARSVLDAFDVAGVLVSGVAGSPHRIGDVVVPAKWRLGGERRARRVNRALEALARRAAIGLGGTLERCALVPPAGADPVTVCMPHQPTVVLGGIGSSGDPFGGAALPCTPGGGEVFGCELPGDAGVVAAVRTTAEPTAVDMETAAVARVAREHRLPFLGVRAVSDGAGDPLGDRGFPAQFFDYYRLAADNAARVAEAVLVELAAVVSEPASERTCRLLARGRWRAAARRLDRGR